MPVHEIKIEDLNPKEFIREKIEEIKNQVGQDSAINALSGGIDSSVVTLMGKRALGDQLKTYFIDNGLMRKNEPQLIVALFKELGVSVEIIDAQDKFFDALKGISNPERKRRVVAQTFYKDVFGQLIIDTGAKCLLQGTILTDVDETVAGIKRQHNVFQQLGINPEEVFGYKIIEPLVQLCKDGVKKVGMELGLPKAIYNRIPFPGPGLAARVIGKVSRKRIETVRKATAIVEEELRGTGAFHYLAILHQDRVTGIRNGKRDFGLQIEVRCWNSVDARRAMPTAFSENLQSHLVHRIVTEVPGVVSVTYSITPKPPSTIEAI